MGSKKAPQAPDYTAAANAQAQSSRENTASQAYANRPTINTPWGQQSWETSEQVDPATGQKVTGWTQNLTLSPQQQQALDGQMAVQQGRTEGAQTLLGQAVGNFQTPMDWNSMPQRAGQLQSGQLGQGPQGDPRVANFNGGGNPQAPVRNLGQLQNSGGDPSMVNRQGPQQGPIQGQLSNSAGDWRQTAQNAVWDLQKPMLDEQQAGLETQLANQGLARGGEAWNREMRGMGDARARAQLQAIDSGRQEAGQLFNQDMMAGQFANNAQGQQFNQNLQGMNFENQAAQQEFNNRTGNAQLNNNAMLMGGQFANNAQQQEFNNRRSNAEFQNTAYQQQFQNTQQQAMQRDNRAMQQMQMEMQAGNFNNANRQQAIGEEQMRRGQSLNELNALLTGQQVNMPQMPSFNTSGRADTTNLMGAAQNQYSAQLDAANARNGGSAGLMNGLFSLGGAAMQSGGWGGLFSMGSEPSYKTNVVRIGTHDTLGIGLYTYEYLPQYAEKWGKGRHIGVMADELVKVLPEAVGKDADGDTVVDYERVLG